MPFAPSGTLYLIGNVPLDQDYKNTIDFGDLAEQVAYFTSKASQTLLEYTFTRKDGTLKVNSNLETLYGINYVMYRNYSASKWIFAFVTSKQYLSEGASLLTIATDVFQTYLFNVTWHETFIEREHQNRWSAPGIPIYNTLEENITIGEEYIKTFEKTLVSAGRYFLLITTEVIDGTPMAPVAIQGSPTPFYYYLINKTPRATYMDAQWLCQLIADHPEVISVAYIPFLPFDTGDPNVHTVTYTWNAGASSINMMRISGDVASKALIGYFNKLEAITLPSTFTTGRARAAYMESKLLTHPYCYNLLTDLQSEPMVLKNEYLTGDNDVYVSVTQTISINPKSKLYISSGYLGEIDGKLHGLTNAQVNDLPLKNYEYYNYMLSHKAQIVSGLAVSAAGSAGTVAAAVAAGPIGAAVVGGAALSSVAAISGELAKQKDLKNVPPTVKNMGNNISFEIADGNEELRVMRYTATDKVLNVVADYFAMFGYKSSRVQIPDLRSRYYYNYIKTLSCNIDGDMDTEDLAKLQGIFNRGVTIWHNRAGVVPLSYLYDNVEMSLV